MKATAKIVLFAMLIAFSIQSTTMAAQYKLKPAGEIAGNLFGMGVDKAKENPEQTEKIAKDLLGTDEPESPDSEEEEKDKKNDE